MESITVNGIEYDWGYEYDSDWASSEGSDALTVALLDADSGEVLDSVGGVWVDSLSVSDHGNVNVSPEDERYLRGVAWAMATEAAQ